MALTREVSLQTLAVLDKAEMDLDRLVGSGQLDQVAEAFGFLLRLLDSSSSRLEAGMALNQHDTKVDKTAKSLSTFAHFLSTPESP